MYYIKIMFTYGLSGYAYQEVNSSGVVVDYLDEKGEEIDMFDASGKEVVYEAIVIEEETTLPFEPREEVAVETFVVEEEQMPQTIEELEEKIRLVIAEEK